MSGKFNTEQLIFSIICLILIAFLLVFMLYIAGYYTFVDKKVNLMDVVFCMLFKPQYLIPVFVIMILCTYFASTTLGIILLFTGTFFLFALEVLVFIQMLYYRELTGGLQENDEFYYLIHRSEQKNK